MSEVNELEIVNKARAGDSKAFSMLMRDNQDRIFAMIYRLVGNRALAEDLSQETFIKAYKNLKGFRAEAKFSTWLTRIALNQTNTYFKSRAFKQSSMSDEFSKKDFESENENAETELIKKQRLVAFRKVLAELKPKYREVLILCGLENKSYDEAAQILEIPVGTVRSRLNSARLKARKSLNFKELSV